jgi:ketosteroid isomerase-like protein
MRDANVQNLRVLASAFSTQTIHALCEAWRRGEVDLSLLDREVVYEDQQMPDHAGETYRGHEGVLRAMETWSEPFEEMTNELQRILGSGDLLVSIHRLRATARYTGIRFEEPSAYVWVFRDGKVIHVTGFRDPDEALTAAGLEE